MRGILDFRAVPTAVLDVPDVPAGKTRISTDQGWQKNGRRKRPEPRTEQKQTKQTRECLLPDRRWLGLPGDWEFPRLLSFRPGGVTNRRSLV